MCPGFQFSFEKGCDQKLWLYRFSDYVESRINVKFGTPVVLAKDFDLELRAGDFCLIIEIRKDTLRLFSVRLGYEFELKYLEVLNRKSKKSSYFPVNLAFSSVKHHIQGDSVYNFSLC